MLNVLRPLQLRSFIAAYIGNIVGALFVAIPAVYFYLSDYRAGGLVDAEAGEAYAEKMTEIQSEVDGNGHKRED